jgi:hypothetical protein
MKFESDPNFPRHPRYRSSTGRLRDELKPR